MRQPYRLPAISLSARRCSALRLRLSGSGSDIGGVRYSGQLMSLLGILWPEALGCFLGQHNEQRLTLSLCGRDASKLPISFYVPLIEKPVQIQSVHIHSSTLMKLRNERMRFRLLRCVT